MPVAVKMPRTDVFAPAVFNDECEAQDIYEWDYFKDMRSHLTGAKVLKIRRENAHISQQELARALSVDEQDIADMETGRRAITKETALALAAALGCSPVDMV